MPLRNPAPAAAQPVVADVAVETQMPIQITAIGSVQSIATVMIKSRIDGQIKEVHFKEGHEVNEGDVLFTLDDRALRAQLAQSEAALERDRASLQRAKLEVARQSGLATRGVASAQSSRTWRPHWRCLKPPSARAKRPSKTPASTWPTRRSRRRSAAGPDRSPSRREISSRRRSCPPRRRWSRSRSCGRST